MLGIDLFDEFEKECSCSSRRIGYARVSTRDQNLDLQRDALEGTKCDRVFKATISETKAKRLGLTQALDNLREGDALVVWKLDRLGRSVRDLLDFAGGLGGVGFVSLTTIPAPRRRPDGSSSM